MRQHPPLHLGLRSRSGFPLHGGIRHSNTHVRYRNFGTGRFPRSRNLARLLHNYFPDHHRVHRTEVAVRTGLGKRERKCIIRVERFGAKCAATDDRVWDVIVVDPRTRRSLCHRNFLWREAEIIDADPGARLVLLCPGEVGLPNGCGADREHQQGKPNRYSDKRESHDFTSFAEDIVCSGFSSSDVSTIASVCRPRTKLISVMPRTARSLSAGTFMGPGDGACPGAGCGKAVDIAV